MKRIKKKGTFKYAVTQIGKRWWHGHCSRERKKKDTDNKENKTKHIGIWTERIHQYKESSTLLYYPNYIIIINNNFFLFANLDLNKNMLEMRKSFNEDNNSLSKAKDKTNKLDEEALITKYWQCNFIDNDSKGQVKWTSNQENGHVWFNVVNKCESSSKECRCTWFD